MKKSTLLFGIIFGITVLTRIALADGKDISEYKTAQECYDAAMKIDRTGISPADQMTVCGRKFALLGQAIALDPKFTQAYVPYVQTYFEQPMGHEYTDSEELDRLSALLKKGLDYNPPNGDEFYSWLSSLEFNLWGDGNKESYTRRLDYIERAISEFPKSKIISNLLLMKSDLLRNLERMDQSRICLRKLVSLNLNDASTESALYQLISDFASEGDYKEVYTFTDKYINLFGKTANYYDFVLYWKTESSFNIGKYDESLYSGKLYIRQSCGLHSRAESCKKLYKIFAEIYAMKGNFELSRKYFEMSRQNED